MKPPTESQAAVEIVEILAELFGAARKAIQIHEVGRTKRFDYSISVAGLRLMAEYKSTASAGPVAGAIDGLKRAEATQGDAALPLLVVPYMGPVGRQLCDQSAISWIDLCGNAKIVAPGLRIWIEGRPNKFSDRGRPPNLFAPKSSRIARQLLLNPLQFQTQAELTRRSGLGDGYVSKTVRRLQHEQYLETNEAGGVRPCNPDLLLDAWHDAYDFNRHRIIRGHVPARTGDELLHRVVQQLAREKLDSAVTGLSAAWLYTHYATFRLATIFVSSMPPRTLLSEMEFSDEPKGANLWLVLPNDEGVLHGSEMQNGIRCVSPVQTFLDLKQQPERAKEAAAELRGRRLTWGRHGT